MGKIKNAMIKIDNKYQCFKRRRRLRYKDFSIISNNCWGGFIYQYFGLKYTSPTIGLFIMEKDYVKFCSDLKYYISLELEFIKVEESKYYMKLTNGGKDTITYPVARLDDIEVFFMHYTSKEEAKEKWERRRQRINYDRLLIKMSQRNDCDYKTLKDFCELPYKNKVCFTEQEQNDSCCIKINGLSELNKRGGDEAKMIFSQIDVTDLLNSL